MINEISTINGVNVTQDGDVMHFEPVEPPKTTIQIDDRSWWQKLKDWWNNAPIKPYVKIRDLADPFGDRTDPDAGSDGKSGIEAGIKISF